jgi:predicted membrane channel-forming protein YqfA (hemolysin III family)
METEQEVKELEEKLQDIDYKPIEGLHEKKFFKDKSGNKISAKEFMSRWKEGMQNLTPIQRTKNDLASTWIILIGFIASIIALIFFNKTFGLVTYGIIIIFIGSIYSNVIKLFSLQGQYKIYKNIEEQTKEVENGN